MKKTFTTLLLIVIAFTINAQTSVIPYTSKDVTPEGIIYHLPKRTLKITATAKCTISKPGPFYRYAERFFAQKDIIIEDKKEWSLSNVELSYGTIKDPNDAFEIKANVKDISNFISFANDGIIKGINLPYNNNFSNENVIIKHNTKNKDIKFNMNILGEEALIANSIPKMAELAAKQIYRIRESRSALINGDVEIMPTGDAMKDVLLKMDEMEKELLELFFGKTISYKEQKEYIYTPEDDVTNHVIFRISSAEGLLPANNIIGDPVYIEIKGTYPLAPVPALKTPKVLGLAYKVPGSASISIYNNESKYIETQTVIPQFGYVLHLPAQISDRDKVSIEYNINTGEIISITRSK